MKQLVIKYNNYCIYEVDLLHLHEIAIFVVEENYKHHHGVDTPEMSEEIESVYQEELAYAENSKIFIVENHQKQMIGCIRVLKWNMRQRLPLQKLFDINPLEYISVNNETTFWHIGRFAISSCSGISCGTLFKQLMIYAIDPICQEVDSCMIAECDSKLLRTMTNLGINTISMGKGVYYLGSETIPVYANKEGLMGFYQNYNYLHHKYSSVNKWISAD